MSLSPLEIYEQTYGDPPGREAFPSGPSAAQVDDAVEADTEAADALGLASLPMEERRRLGQSPANAEDLLSEMGSAFVRRPGLVAVCDASPGLPGQISAARVRLLGLAGGYQVLAAECANSRQRCTLELDGIRQDLMLGCARLIAAESSSAEVVHQASAVLAALLAVDQAATVDEHEAGRARRKRAAKDTHAS